MVTGNTPKKVLIGVPVFALVEPEFLGGYGSLVAECCRQESKGEYKFDAVVVPRNSVSCTRVMLVDAALQGNYDYLFMIDDDMLPPPDAFFKLVRHHKPVISGLIFMRRAPYWPALFREANIQGSDRLNYQPLFDIHTLPEGLYEIDAAGAACILIDVNIFSKILRPYFWMGEDYGEDIFFCDKVRKEGKTPIYVDTSVDVGHLSDRLQINRAFYSSIRKTLPMQEVKYNQSAPIMGVPR